VIETNYHSILSIHNWKNCFCNWFVHSFSAWNACQILSLFESV